MVIYRLILAAAVVATTASAQVADEGASTQVYVTTEPAGALITCDGTVRDVSPVALLDLTPGKHLIAASKQGYRDARRTISLAPGQRLPVELQLEPLTGLLLLHSTPAGADVEVDGAHRGQTPLLLVDLPLGEYRVRFNSPGYQPKVVAVRLDDRTPQRIDADLVSDTAVLEVAATPPGAKVLLNGIARGTAPCRIEGVPEGDATIRITHDGFGDFERALRVVAGQEIKISAVLEELPATLTVRSMPEGARVYVGNQYRGKAPLTLDGLAPGDYRLRVELEAHDPMARTVSLPRAAEVTEEFRLRSNTGSIEVTTEPAGVKVLVDGKERGITTAAEGDTDRVSLPLRIERIEAGERELTFVKPGFFGAKVALEVERDETAVRHVPLKRRFIPNYEVKTANRVYRGVYVEIAEGKVRLETAPGVITPVPLEDVVSRGPLRETELPE